MASAKDWFTSIGKGLRNGLMFGAPFSLPGLFSIGSKVYENAKENERIANERNYQYWLEEQAYNSAEAQKNRDFQLMMSNTAHQRQVDDLKAAGLNPWLSAGNGAPMAVGSTASSAAPTANPVGITSSDLVSIISSVSQMAGYISIAANKGKK